MAAGSANLLEIVVRAVAIGVEAALGKAVRGVDDLAKGVEAASFRADKAFRAMESSGKDLAAGFESSVGRIESVLTGALAAGAAAAAAGFVAAGHAVEEFSSKLTEIGTLGVAADELDRYREALAGIAETTSVSLVDLSEGLYETISAGVTDAAEATKLLDVAQKAAVAGVTDTRTTVDLLTTALNTFGAGATSAEERLDFITRAADKFNVAVDIGKVRTEDFGKGLGRVAPTAVAMGVSLDEVAAAVATMTARGIPAEQAFNAINQAIAKIGAPGDKAREVAEALGVTLGEGAIRAKGFTAVLQEIIDRSGGSVEALRPLLEDIDALRVVTSLGVDGLDGFRDALGKIGAASGETEADFAKMSETLANRLGNLRNVVLTKLIPAFENELFPVVSDVVGKLADFVAENGDGIARTFVGVVNAMRSVAEFLAANGPTIISILGAIFAKKVVDLFLGGIVSATQALGGLGTAFKVMGSAATGTWSAVGSGATGAASKVAAVAGAASTIAGAFLAIVPIVVAVVDKVISELNRAEERAKALLAEINKATSVAVTGTSKEIKALSEEMKALAAVDVLAARDRAKELLSIEHARAVESGRIVEGLNARILALEETRKNLGLEILREGRTDARLEAVKETEDAIDEMKTRIAVERRTTEERVKVRALLAEFAKGSAEEILEAEAAAAEAGISVEIDAASAKKASHEGVKADALAKIRAIEDGEKDSLAKRLKAIEEFAEKARDAIKRAIEDLAGSGAVVKDFGESLEAAAADADFGAAVDEWAKRVDQMEAITARGIEAGLRDGASEGAQGMERLIERSVERAGQEGASDGIQRGAEEGAEEAAPSAGEAFAAAIGKALLKVATMFGNALLDAAKGIGDFFLDLFVTGPLSEFWNLLALASQTPAEAQTTTDPETGEVTVDQAGFADVLGETLDGFIQTIINFVQNLPTLLRNLIPFVGEIVQAFADAVPQIIQAFVSNLGPLIEAIIGAVRTLTQTFVDNIDDVLSGLESAIEAWLPELVDALIDLILSSLDQDVSNRITQMVFDVISQLVQGIISAIPGILEYILQTAAQNINGLISMILGELVPAIIRMIPDLIGSLIENLPEFITELVGGLIGSILEALPEIFRALIDGFLDPTFIFELIGAIFQGIWGALQQIWQSFSNMFADLFGEGGRIAGNVIMAILTLGLSEINRGRRERRHREERQAESYDEAVTEWQNQATGQSQEWLATHPPPDPADYAHTGGVVLPGGGVQRFQFGGIVRAIEGAFARRPSDVPIVAEAGEGVLNAGAVARMGAGAVHEMNAGGGAGGSTYVINGMIVDPRRALDGQVAELLERGRGRTGAASERRRGVPVRPVPKFGSA